MEELKEIMKKNFSKRLNEIMDDRGYKQADLVRITGLDKGALSSYLHARYLPKTNKIYIIAESLNVNPLWLMGLDEPKFIRNNTPKNAIAYTELPDIPIIGAIHAGQAILAVENIEGYEKADVKNPEEYFYLRVEGDCMIGAGIADGSKVLVHKQNVADDGQIVVCLVNGDDATLKRYKEKNDTVILTPANPIYEPIIINKKDFDIGYAKIIGVAVKVLTNLL